MAGSRRQLSWRARHRSIKLKEGSKKVAVTCLGDLLTTKLIPIKFTFFIIMGATSCLSYVTLQMKALGLTVEEAGIIYSITPIIPIFAPFFAGIIADKLGNFRLFLAMTVALSGLSALIFLVIPPARTTPKYSPKLSFSLTCQGNFILTPNMANENCKFYNKTVIINTLNVNKCGYQCDSPVLAYPENLHKKMNKLKFRLDEGKTVRYICEIDGKVPQTAQKCFRTNLNKTKAYENMPETYKMRNVILGLTSIDLRNPRVEVASNQYTMAAEDLKAFECTKGKIPKTVSLTKISFGGETDLDPKAEPEKVACHLHCEASVPHNLTCEDRPHSIEHNVAFSFWLYVVARIINTVMIGLTYTLFESAVVAVLKEYGYDYGLQRVYGSVGAMVFAPLTGFLIDEFGKGGSHTDYYISFLFYCALKIFCALLLLTVNLDFKAPSPSICRNIGSLLRNIEVPPLIFSVVISGMCYGYIENFLPWHLRDMKASNWLIGLTTTVASVSAIPFLMLSGPICAKFGHVQAIVFGLVCYAIRGIGYSLLKDPWWCLPIEILEGATTGLLLASAIIYAARLSNRYNVGTLQGILAAAHYGIGKSLGSLLGGYLMERLKAPATFQIFSGIALTAGFAYYLVLKLLLQPRQARRDKRIQEIMAMPVKTITHEELERSRSLQRYHRRRRNSFPDVEKAIENGVAQDVKENETLNETQVTVISPDVSQMEDPTIESEREHK
ncbi:major facilitator superfamily domain-containing protein 6-B-like [Oratosquilla oratoria]|uniref:major facilitator superfamily domain-containing protein 6-B-like n=1 Tax=Oratosquilla oratoria TaxID=337810 RepID=UPI003F7604B6